MNQTLASIFPGLRGCLPGRGWSSNESKHGVTFEEAMTVFADPLAVIFDDEEHSDEEPREIIVGHSAKGRLLLVSFTERGETVRIISARRATKRERKDYEESPFQ